MRVTEKENQRQAERDRDREREREKMESYTRVSAGKRERGDKWIKEEEK